MVVDAMVRDEMRNGQLQQQRMATNYSRHDKRLQRHSRLVGQNIARKYQRAAVRRAEYRRLKAIVPSVADKKSVSKVCNEID